MQKTVLFSAPLLTQSGYGCHAKMIFRWLLSVPNINLHCECVPWGDTNWVIDENAENGLIGEILKRTSAPSSPDVSIQLKLPNEFQKIPGAFNIGISAMVETDKCNPSWVVSCNTMDMIIVPSNHAKQALLNSGGVLVPIHVIPESYIDEIAGNIKHTDFQFDTQFNFLIFGQITGNNSENDRKNTFNTIRWLCEAFANKPDVGIVLKTNLGHNTHLDRDKTKQLLASIMSEIRKTAFPKLHLLHGDMTNDEIASLYVNPSIKALVSLTHGEGFGLPTLEAAASGLPVIATGWSGHMDFLKQGKFMNISYTLNDVHKSRLDDHIFQQGMRWAYPDENDFKKKALRFYESSKIPKEWAMDLKNKVQTSNSFEATAKIYSEVMKEIL